MLIKRKLHWMGARKTGKIHPEKPHRNSREGRERKRERERDSGWMKREREREMDDRRKIARQGRRDEKMWFDLRNR